MKTKYIIAAFALALSGAAYAAPGGESNNTGCNGVGNSNSPCGGTNNGGGGGAGGGGGQAAQQQGQLQGQAQGQLQGQQQGQGQAQGQIGINKNANLNTNVNANSNQQGQSSVNANNNKAVSGSESESAALAKATNAGNTQGVTINTFNPGNINYSGEYTIKSAPAIGIPGPASGACNGFSATAGVSVVGFGAGGGVSLLDETCVDDRAAARFVHMAQAAASMGATALAQKYMMMAEDIQVNSEAYKRSQQRKQEAQPKPAPRAEVAPAPAPVRTATATTAPAQTAGIQQPRQCVSDEFIARRMGVPVCKP